MFTQKKNLFLLLIFFPICLLANDFDSLLQNYKQAAELSNKTKDEAVGNLIVYTRDDIERMQANTLKDILKSMRFFPYEENRIGQSDLINVDPIVNGSGSIRVYLNEHELNSPLLGSGFMIFGDIELDFIDHLEIYQGFPAFDFGTEPATIVIRLYSKTAEHHSGGKIKAQLGTYGSNTLSAYLADESDGLSYLAYASRRENERKNSYYEGQSLLRDSRNERVYLSVKTDQHHFELHGSHTKAGGFIGNILSIDSPFSIPGSSTVPNDSLIRSKYMSASIHSQFQDKTLELTASIMKSTKDSSFQYNPAFSFRPNLVPLGQIHVNSTQGRVLEDSYTLGMTKKWLYDKHTFSTGLKFRHNSFDLTNASDLFLFTGSVIPLPDSSYEQPYNNTDIYAIFAQDEYALNENQIITLSLMLEHYHNKHTDIEDKTLTQARLGYILTHEAWVAKTFLTHEEFAPEPYQIVTPAALYSNENLDKSTFISILQEVSYQTSQTLTKFILGFNKTKGFPIPDATLKLQNSSDDLNVILTSIEETISFNQNDKLEIQVYSLSLDNTGSYAYSPTHGGMIRMLNSYHQFDFFNEFIVLEKQSNLSHNSHDFNTGVIYHATNDLQFNLKAENLFQNSAEQDYTTQIDAITQNINYLTEPINDRRIWIGMELLF